MDSIVRGLFESLHPEDVKKQVFKKLKLSAKSSTSKLTPEIKQSLINICLEYVLLGSEFEHQEAALLLKEYLSYCSNECRHVFTNKFVENLLEGDWVYETLAAEAQQKHNYQAKVPIFRRIVVTRILLEEFKSKSMKSEMLFIVIHIKTEALRLLYDCLDHRTFAEICRLLTGHQQCMPPMSRGFALCNISIHAMSDFVPLSDDLKTCENYIKDIADISSLVRYVWLKEPATLLPSLVEIFRIISSNNFTEPSNALGCLVEFIPSNMIENVVRQLVNDQTLADEKMSLALTRMVSWIGWPRASQAHLWVLCFFKELASVSKFSMLINVTMKTIKQVFVCLHIPFIRGSALAVLCHMLMSNQNSADAFHIIVPLIPEMIKHIEMEDNQEANNTHLQQITNLCHCMMQLHTGFPELYGPLLCALEAGKYSKPSKKEIQAAFLHNSWTSKQQSYIHEYHKSRSQETDKAGLINLGNTCYMNSVVQALFMADDFRLDILKLSAPHNSIIESLRTTFAFLFLTQRLAFEPIQLVERSRPSWFMAGSQQDCSEYLKYLLDRIHEEEKNSLQNFQQSPPSSSQGRLQCDSTCVSQTEIAENTIKKSRTSQSQTSVEKLFHGKLKTTIRCQTCNYVSSREETFVDIALPLNKAHERGGVAEGRGGSTEVAPGQTGNSPNSERRSVPGRTMQTSTSSVTSVEASSTDFQTMAMADNQRAFLDEDDGEVRMPIPVQEDMEDDEECEKRTHELNDLLHHYLAEEDMEGDNQYHCSNCNCLRNAVKTSILTELSRYLLITLMRFTYNTLEQRRTKILDNVEIPQEISVPKHDCSGQQLIRYNLCSVIVHSGTSADSGHYYCYAKQHTASGDKWFLFNDSHVSVATFCNIQELTSHFARDTAYVLIYRQLGGSGASSIGDCRELISRSLLDQINADNSAFLKELEEASKRESSSSRLNVLGWNNDNNPPPPPTCGGSGDGQISSNRFIY